MPTSSPSIQICQRFNEIRWHDAELRSFLVNYSPPESGCETAYEITLTVDLSTFQVAPRREVFTPIELKFIHPRYFRSDVDLLGMSYCVGDIAYAECSGQSDFKRQVLQTKIVHSDTPEYEKYWNDLSHFHIYLCDPSGEINVIAEDFEIRNLPANITNDGRTITTLRAD
jgi:hypothetical protein